MYHLRQLALLTDGEQLATVCAERPGIRKARFMSPKIRRLIAVAIIAAGAAAATAPVVSATAGTQHAVADTWVRHAKTAGNTWG